MNADALNGWRVTANAVRLLSDAEFLAAHSRCASAFALAVLAMEEIGKLILQEWCKDKPLPEARRNITFHVRKQTAVAYLLAAPMMIDEIRKNRLRELDSEAAVEALARTLCESGEGQWMRQADLGFVEKTKHVSLYSDPQFEEMGLLPRTLERSM